MGTGFTGGCRPRALGSLDAAVQWALCSLDEAVPQALGSLEGTVRWALASLVAEVPQARG